MQPWVGRPATLDRCSTQLAGLSREGTGQGRRQLVQVRSDGVNEDDTLDEVTLHLIPVSGAIRGDFKASLLCCSPTVEKVMETIFHLLSNAIHT